MILQSITLKVKQLSLMSTFYQKNFGFFVRHQSSSDIHLGTPDKTLLVLTTDPIYELPTEVEVGMYHMAFLFPSVSSLATQLAHLLTLKTPLSGLSDHGVSEAIYLTDPEDNGIELYVDRPKNQWPMHDGQLLMGTKMMDYMALLKHAKTFQSVDPFVTLGHLHMHTRDLEKSRRFYQRAFGMDLMQAYGTQALFLSYHQYHHHLGVNTWLGEDAVVLKKESTGYASSTWILETHESFDHLEKQCRTLGYNVTKEKEGLRIINDDQQTFLIRSELLTK